MNTISKILVPYDFSDISKQALDYTVAFIGDEEIKIDLIHVSNDPDYKKMRDTYETLCATYEGQLKVPITWALGWDGTVSDIIVEAQKKKKADLIVMGTSGISDEHKTTETSKLVQKAKCPVLVIPNGAKRTNLKNISLVLGKDEIDRPKSLNTLLDISQKFNSKVHVLTVQNTPGTFGYSDTDEKNENALMYHLESFYSEHTFIENPDILEGIFSYVSTHDIDMIAILPRNHAKRNEPSDGLLTKELVLRANIPVLTIE